MITESVVIEIEDFAEVLLNLRCSTPATCRIRYGDS